MRDDLAEVRDTLRATLLREEAASKEEDQRRVAQVCLHLKHKVYSLQSALGGGFGV